MILRNLRNRIVVPQSADITEKNIRYLYFEIAFAAVLGAIVTFNNLLAVRLGATAVLIGILTSAPSLITAILSIPSARFLEGKRDHKTWLLNSLLFMRLGYLGVVLLPIIAPNNTAVWITVLLLVLVLPNALFTNGFNAILGDLIPEKRRAFVFSRRTILWSLVSSVVIFVAGIYLDHTEKIFPANYQLMYLFGIIVVLGSQHYLWKLVIAEVRTIPHTRGDRSDKVTHMPLSRPMRRYLVNVFIYMCGIQLPASLFVLHYVNNLHASDGLISLNSSLGTLSYVFGLFLWERVIRKYGFFLPTRIATCFTWIFPFTVALTVDFPLVIAANIVVNLIHPGMDLSVVNLIFKLCTPEQRNMAMSYYTTVLGIAAFAAPLVAVPLSGLISIPGVMLISAFLRFSGGLMFNINRVQEEAAPQKPTLQAAA